MKPSYHTDLTGLSLAEIVDDYKCKIRRAIKEGVPVNYVAFKVKKDGEVQRSLHIVLVNYLKVMDVTVGMMGYTHYWKLLENVPYCEMDEIYKIVEDILKCWYESIKEDELYDIIGLDKYYWERMNDPDWVD